MFKCIWSYNEKYPFPSSYFLTVYIVCKNCSYLTVWWFTHDDLIYWTKSIMRRLREARPALLSSFWKVIQCNACLLYVHRGRTWAHCTCRYMHGGCFVSSLLRSLFPSINDFLSATSTCVSDVSLALYVVAGKLLERELLKFI